MATPWAVRWRKWLSRALVVCVVAGAPASAAAIVEPVEADGTATTVQGALKAARKAALEQALAELPVDADPARVQEVLSRASAWTSAYRILEQESDDAKVHVRVEVQVDTKRLAKRVARRVEGSAAGFRLGSVTASTRSCASAYAEELAGELEAFGVVESKGLHAIDLSLTCHDLGPVSWTRLQAAQIEIEARGPGGVLARTTAIAFEEDVDAARTAALERASADLSVGLLDELRGGLTLWVHRPEPSARVRTLVEGLRRSVMGVDSAQVAFIGADGAVGIRVTGSLSPQGLQAALSELELPGFGLSGYRPEGERALHIDLQ